MEFAIREIFRYNGRHPAAVFLCVGKIHGRRLWLRYTRKKNQMEYTYAQC